MISIENEIRKNIVEETRPWGSFIRYACNQSCTVKLIKVKEDQALSKQSHKNRDELWVVLDHGLRVVLGDRTFDPSPDDVIFILRNTKHQLISLGHEGRVLEISFGDFDENDVKRFEDIYGRT